MKSSSFRDYIWSVDLADIQSLRKYSKGIKYLLCVDCSFKKQQNNNTTVNAFQKIISKGRKPNKIWGDQGGKFYSKLFERF